MSDVTIYKLNGELMLANKSLLAIDFIGAIIIDRVMIGTVIIG